MTPPTPQPRPAVAPDIAEVVALERATENTPHWPPAAYAEILAPHPAAPRRCLFVARTSNGLLAGFSVGLLQPGSSQTSHLAELESVAVAASARRAGIGRSLCNAVLDWSRAHGADEIILEVRAASAGAIALYTSLGFVETGRRPRYYHDPADDALLMQLRLEASSRSAQE